MVGVLIEVPVMLLVVRVVNKSKGWYEAGKLTAGSGRREPEEAACRGPVWHQ